ncbi:hypothetical protein [Crateriforma conspicua]|uniref:Uncharacterized protein n=1 Tax=Crateriforma conspicua TaxID=2527996 RepID=A0A5C5Y4M4_9PLAN|nr:hypothetical protein [Crateriforma conspicua]QDV62886.1 hypothetical protein Mal65_20230 [Crateriforma conspicua]TWT68342.1 hypothetical protein Pan14r_05860 [Crateriforma conspicua]TWU61697.1 hypothetical protein V7x_33850 [Crateriforma conspicua]
MPSSDVTLSQQDAKTILNESYLEVRSKMLEIAAALDRMQSAPGGDGLGDSDKRIQLDQAIEILASDDPDRAARLQFLFSRPYDAQWREKMEL